MVSKKKDLNDITIEEWKQMYPDGSIFLDLNGGRPCTATHACYKSGSNVWFSAPDNKRIYVRAGDYIASNTSHGGFPDIPDKPIEHVQVQKSMDTFDSGSRRDSSLDKPNVYDVHPYAMLRHGFWMKIGEVKYGKGNWELGQPKDRVLDSLKRHVNMAIMQIADPVMFSKIDNGRDDHLSAIIFNASMLLMTEGKEGVEPNKYLQLFLQDEQSKTSANASQELNSH